MLNIKVCVASFGNGHFFLCGILETRIYYIWKLKMEEAIGFIGASGLSQDEKDTLGGILLADQILAAGINLLHSDGALRSLIRQKQVPAGKLSMLISHFLALRDDFML